LQVAGLKVKFMGFVQVFFRVLERATIESISLFKQFRPVF